MEMVQLRSRQETVTLQETQHLAQPLTQHTTVVVKKITKRIARQNSLNKNNLEKTPRQNNLNKNNLDKNNLDKKNLEKKDQG